MSKTHESCAFARGQAPWPLARLRDQNFRSILEISGRKSAGYIVRAEEAVAKAVILFPLTRHGQTSKVSLNAVIARTPTGKTSIDRFFREGMSLPDLRARNPGEFDLVVTVDEIDLARYLNLCEGKAHLDITQSKEIKTKLEDKGFVPPYPVKNFVKSLPVELRALMTPNITAPDSTVFDAFFSLPDDVEGKEKGRSEKLEDPPPPPPPPPPPKIAPFAVEALPDGFKLKTDPRFSEWPVNVSVRIAYADGSRKPAWSEFDFRPSDLKTEASDCEMQFVKNRLEAKNCGRNCQIEVRGFDTNLELDTQIRFWKHAQTN
jgi:hypothetical protein